MTHHDFRAALKRLGLSQVQLARLLDVKSSAVNRWHNGRAAVPGYASAYVTLAERYLRLLQKGGLT